MDYGKLLEESFQQFLENSGHLHDQSESQRELKAEFLASDIFELTTYDSALDLLFTVNIMEVVKAIHNSCTFDYFKDDHGKYVNYITCVNLPWFKDKLDWGTSIRGAWWEHFCVGLKYSYDRTTSIGNGMLWYEGEQVYVTFTESDEWKKFIDCLISFWEN